MLKCSLCEGGFSSNDDLRVHLEGHASQMFDSSDEELQENEIKTGLDFDQESDDGSLVFDCVKEEEQSHCQNLQEATQIDVGHNESHSLAPYEAVEKSRKLREREFSTKTLNCSKCSFKTMSKKYFKVHMNQMHLNKHKCNHCPKRYPSKGYLANHIRKEHMKNEDKTKLPEDEFFRIAKKWSNPNKRLYECLKCTYKTESMTKIYRHIRGVHKNLLDELYKSKGMVLGDAAYHKCTKCFFKTMKMGNLKRHIKGVHQKRRDFVCDLCKKTFSAKHHLISHMKYIHISAEPSKLHKCSICSYKFIDKTKLKVHLKVVHLKIRRYTCNLCRKQFSRKDHLRKHIEKRHLEKKILSCNRGRNCSFRTTEKRELARHIRREHDKIQGFSCEICGKWYSSRSSLFWHKQNHTMEGNRLTCDLCQSTTKNKHYMHIHMKRMHLKKGSE